LTASVNLTRIRFSFFSGIRHLFGMAGSHFNECLEPPNEAELPGSPLYRFLDVANYLALALPQRSLGHDRQVYRVCNVHGSLPLQPAWPARLPTLPIRTKVDIPAP